MRRPGAHRGGYTLLEVMIAMVVLLVGMAGFVGTSITAAASSNIANARTSLAFVRGALVDRLTVTPRSVFSKLPAAWTLDSCYDAHSLLLQTNASYSSSFTCPTAAPSATVYQAWIKATPNATSTGWQIQTYVERADVGCTNASDATRAARFTSSACAPADLLLTD